MCYMNKIKCRIISIISDNRYICIFLILIMAISVGGYLGARLEGQTISYGKWFTDSCLSDMNLITIVTTVFVAVLSIEQNARITEGKLIKELNSEFINNAELAHIESKLEKYFESYTNNGNSYEGIKLDINSNVGGSERQALVNYLVHLEAIAALVNNKVLRLNAINDLVAYRFFIALNNPDVQKLEITPFFYYYSGCINLYRKWENILRKKHIPIPMERNGGVIKELARELEGK